MVACFLTRGDLYQSWEEGARVFDKCGSPFVPPVFLFFFSFECVSPGTFPRTFSPFSTFFSNIATFSHFLFSNPFSPVMMHAGWGSVGHDQQERNSSADRPLVIHLFSSPPRSSFHALGVGMPHKVMCPSNDRPRTFARSEFQVFTGCRLQLKQWQLDVVVVLGVFSSVRVFGHGLLFKFLYREQVMDSNHQLKRMGSANCPCHAPCFVFFLAPCTRVDQVIHAPRTSTNAPPPPPPSVQVLACVLSHWFRTKK